MDMLADFTAASRELMNVLGDSVQGTIMRNGVESEPLTLYVDDGLQNVGQHAPVVTNKRAVAAMNADWIFARGDIVNVRGRAAKVDQLQTNDGIVNTAVLLG